MSTGSTLPNFNVYLENKTNDDEELKHFNKMVTEGPYESLGLQIYVDKYTLSEERLLLVNPADCKDPYKLLAFGIKWTEATDTFVVKPGYLVQMNKGAPPVMLLLASEIISLHKQLGVGGPSFVDIYRKLTHWWGKKFQEAQKTAGYLWRDYPATVMLVDIPPLSDEDDEDARFLAALEVAAGAPGMTAEKQGLLEGTQDPNLYIKYDFDDDENLAAVQRLRLAVGVIAFFGKSTDLERIDKYRTNAEMPLARAMAIVAPPRPTPRKKTGFLGFLGRLFGW